MWTHYSDKQRIEAVQMMKDAGVQSVRIDLSWSWLENLEDTYWWEVSDPAIQLAFENDLEILAMVGSTPPWATSDRSFWFPPNDPANYANFVGDIVERYDGDGIDDAPGSPRIRYWELWNEPNIIQFWSSGPNASEYVKLLQAGYVAAKHSDPSATVMMAGLICACVRREIQVRPIKRRCVFRYYMGFEPRSLINSFG